jgi:hypothetical protein
MNTAYNEIQRDNEILQRQRCVMQGITRYNEITSTRKIQGDNEIQRQEMCDARDYEIQRDNEHKEDTRR